MDATLILGTSFARSRSAVENFLSPNSVWPHQLRRCPELAPSEGRAQTKPPPAELVPARRCSGRQVHTCVECWANKRKLTHEEETAKVRRLRTDSTVKRCKTEAHLSHQQLRRHTLMHISSTAIFKPVVGILHLKQRGIEATTDTSAKVPTVVQRSPQGDSQK